MTPPPDPKQPQAPDSAAEAPAPDAGNRAPAEAILLGFARALRAAGVPVTADRERGYLRATAEVGLGSQPGTYWAGRATLCATPDDLVRYDRVYAAWFGSERAGRAGVAPVRVLTQAELAAADQDDSGGRGDRSDVLRADASAAELLRHRDIATLTASEQARLARLFGSLAARPPRRRARRHTGSRRGEIDARATLREQLRRMGEPGPVRRRRRGSRARRVVLLIDVSGSMATYADALLRLAHCYVRRGGPVEVFTMGTRLTHVTRALAHRDPEQALVAAGQVVPDWSGGTRLAESVAVFLRRWGRRGMARGAVVVVCSDGWEREHPAALGQQIARLQALAHRVFWVNPHTGRPGYAPVQSGIAAVLPHCDELVAGHSLAAFERVVEVVASA